MNMTPPNHHGSNSKQNYADEMINYYFALIKKARTLLFSPVKLGWLLPDMTSWSNTHKRIYFFLSPVSLYAIKEEDNPEIKDIYKVLNLEFSLFTYILYLGFFIGIAPDLSEVVSRISTQAVNLRLIIGLILIFLLFFLPIIVLTILYYFRLIEFLRNNRYPILVRLGIMFIYFTVLFLMPPFTEPGNISNYYFRTFTSAELIDTVTLFVMWGAMFSYLLFLVMEVGLTAGVYLVYLIYNLLTSHDPHPGALVTKLAIEEIQLEQEPNRSFLLFRLKNAQICALKEWYQSGREASAMKLLPTTIILAAFALFIEPNTFSQLNNYISEWLKQLKSLSLATGTGILNFSTQIVVPIIIGTIIILILLYLIGIWINLFKSLFVQSLIIEACVLSEYLTQPSSRPKKYRRSIRKSFRH